MLLVIVRVVVVVHLNHQTTEVCPTDVPRPVSQSAWLPEIQPTSSHVQRGAAPPQPTADIRR